MSVVVDLILLLLVGGITYALMSEGLWGAALMFFNVLFAALISLNFYEPLAQLIVDNATIAANFADSLSLMLLFIVSLLLLRLATESIAPSMVRFPSPVYHLGRLIFGFGGSVITIAMILLGFQTSPVQKKMLGVMSYDYVPLYKERFDRDLLAFFQYTTGYTFARNGAGAYDREFPAKPMLFDPKAEWLINHQRFRPYGDEAILKDDTAASATGGSTPAGATPAGPQAASGQPGPSIPGGTAGAAAGLAPLNP